VQYPVVAFIDAIATCITEATGIYCIESNKAYFGHLWVSHLSVTLGKTFLKAHRQLNIIRILSVSLATIAIIKFYMTLKSHIAQHKLLPKLLALKLIVGLVFLENVCHPP
jgi:hypothetical protein